MGLRAPSDLSDRVELKAREIGVSKNAFLLILIDLGFKVYENVKPPAQPG
jgi:hypothetical protein